MVSNADPTLDLVWSYARRFCCEQLFRDQKSGIFQLESSGLRDPQRIDRLLLVVAIDVLVSSLQGFAVSLSGLRRQLDPHWQRGMSFVRLGLLWIQHSVTNASQRFMASLDADPAARTGAVHPQSWHATPLERDLFHADCAAATATTQRADHFCLGA